ncbi:C6 transcription factor [Penicillium tannophilum]|nr:C6 transcription factor [Penicillium tannophilum]
MERGIAHGCRRRSEVIRKEAKRQNCPPKLVSPPTLRGASTNTTSGPPAITPQQSINSEPGPNAVDSVTQDAAVMLEFLALSRQHVLEAAQVDQPQQTESLSHTSELLFTAAQAKELMEYHQDCVAWIHNVVHMPSFLEQCEKTVYGEMSSIEGGWLSLYYAIFAVTLYHAQPSKLADVGIYAGRK